MSYLHFRKNKIAFSSFSGHKKISLIIIQKADEKKAVTVVNNNLNLQTSFSKERDNKVVALGNSSKLSVCSNHVLQQN